MHNNYYLLRQLSRELQRKLEGFTLVSCFSQNKDELVIEFNNARKSIFIKASLHPEFQCLSFPVTFNRARKNTAELFAPLILKKVIGVRQFDNERSFAIQLEQSLSILFAMHGPRANIILFEGDIVTDIFRNNFKADLSLHLDSLDRPLDWSQDHFIKHQNQLEQVYFTFGKAIWNQLREKSFDSMDLKDKWKLLSETKAQLENPVYSIVERQGLVVLSLLPVKDSIRHFTNPMEALSEFFILRSVRSVLQNKKQSLISHLQGKLKQASSYLEKNETKLSELSADTHYQQWADLIMANLTNLQQGQEIVVLQNFYQENQPVEIKLKKELSPQKNAEVLYRKSKNQAIQINTLKTSLDRKMVEINQLKTWISEVERSATDEAVDKLTDLILMGEKRKEVKQALPYHEFEFKGFKILVGKNAVSNDTLTLKHSYKDDLWLHAKDVSGSHVLVKYQAGKPFPKDVIEYAASLAALYSKRKNESLCPVAFTQKKYVRKRKGDPAGAVVVEREEVLLVQPAVISKK